MSIMYYRTKYNFCANILNDLFKYYSHFKGQACQLIVHLDRGFTLLETGHSATAKTIWTFGFDRLKGSADDGTRLLFLDFGGSEGEIVSSVMMIWKMKNTI